MEMASNALPFRYDIDQPPNDPIRETRKLWSHFWSQTLWKFPNLMTLDETRLAPKLD
jgi:hypothetical protein